MNLVFGAGTFDHIWQAAKDGHMTDHDTIDGDLNRLYAAFREFREQTTKQLAEQQHQLAALAVDGHQKAMVVDQRLRQLEQASGDDSGILEDHAGWIEDLISNLYDDPIPGPTEAEWDEAHAINKVVPRQHRPFFESGQFVGIQRWDHTTWRFPIMRLSSPAISLAAADTLMGLFGLHRCPCCEVDD